MIVKLLTEHHLEFLSLKGGCRGSSESTHVKNHIVGNLMHWLINDLVLRSSVCVTYVSLDTNLKEMTSQITY